MGTVAERPDLLERLGGALNSSNLAQRDDRLMPVDVITALAYSQTNSTAGVHAALEKSEIDPRTELGGVLIRLKYGGDHQLEDRALRMFAVWVTHQRAFSRWKISAGGMLDRFCGQALGEWLWQTCETCHGRQFVGIKRDDTEDRRVRCTLCKGGGVLITTLEKSPDGQKLRRPCPRCCSKGWRTIQVPVAAKKAELCKGCGGTGGRIPNDGERMRALGLRQRTYDGHWIKRFSWAAASFDRIDHTAKRCLQSQFRAGIITTQQDRRPPEGGSGQDPIRGT